MIKFKLKVKNLPPDAAFWWAEWNPRKLAELWVPPIWPETGRPSVEPEQELTFLLTEDEADGYIYVHCHDVEGRMIKPPVASFYRDAWRVEATVRSDSYSFDWSTGKLSRPTLKALLIAGGILAVGAMVMAKARKK